MKEMPEKRKDKNLNIGLKLISNFWKQESNNNMKKNKDYKNRLRSREMNFKELSKLKSKKGKLK